MPTRSSRHSRMCRAPFSRLFTTRLWRERRRLWRCTSHNQARHRIWFGERSERELMCRWIRMLGTTRYRPGTWFTDLTGDMVDSFAQDGGEGVEDALERNDEDAGADAVRAGCGRGAVHDDGAVRAIRDQPDDGAQ